MDEYRKTLISAVDAAFGGDLQALLIAQWMLSSLRSGMVAVSADHATPPTQQVDGRTEPALVPPTAVKRRRDLVATRGPAPARFPRPLTTR